MAKQQRTKGPTKTVTIRMPVATYNVIDEVAAAKGIDLAALLNDVISDVLPAFQRWLESRRNFSPHGGDVAKLQSAAPAMLANLQAALWHLENLDIPPAPAALENMRAAIAKAKGE